MPPGLHRRMAGRNAVRYSESLLGGGQKCFCLTTDNIDSLQDSVPMARLSQTFQDAIRITRASGLDYLWVDSLCIIQDDRNDWEKEAATMTSVYRGADLNIAASSAEDGRRGCFTKQEGFCGGFQAMCGTGTQRTWRQFENEHGLEQVTRGCHLATRAWCVQELILAPRVVYIGDHGMFWQCRELSASEFLPWGHREQRTPTATPTDGVSSLTRMGDWLELVEWYSMCHLSVASDKLVALDGLARAVQGQQGDEYLAGMWRSRLKRELCWQRLGPCQPRPANRAPSWSWAAIDGGVHFLFGVAYDDGSHESYVRVRGVDASPAGPQSFGQLLHEHLELCCSTLLLGSHCDGDADGQITLMIDSERGVQRLQAHLDCEEAILATGTLVVLPLRRRHRRIYRDDIFGLLLKPVEPRQLGHFSRVGWFYWQYMLDKETGYEKTDSEYARFMEIVRNDRGIMAKQLCAEIIDEEERSDEGRLDAVHSDEELSHDPYRAYRPKPKRYVITII